MVGIFIPLVRFPHHVQGLPVLRAEAPKPRAEPARSGSPAAEVHVSARGREAAMRADRTDDSTCRSAEDREEQRQVRQLEKRDQQVRAHEQAHMAAGGAYVKGAPTYRYQRGPDGKNYAVGGEVQIDSSPEQDPKDTIAKMQVVRAAANAPADPSAADRAVAAAASAAEAKARAEIRARDREGESSPTRAGARGSRRGSHIDMIA